MKKTNFLSIIILFLIFIIIFLFIFFQQKAQPLSNENIFQLNIKESIEDENLQEEITENNSFTLEEYQPINEEEKELLNSSLINSDYQSIIKTFPEEEQTNVAAIIQLISARILQTNSNQDWWKNLLTILQEQNLLYNFNNFDYNQLSNIKVLSSKLTDSEFQVEDSSNVINQDLIFLSDIQFTQSNSQIINAELIWVFNISCTLEKGCYVNYNELPHLIKAN